MIKEYKTKDLTIIWQPEKCTHAGICVRTLPKFSISRQDPGANLTTPPPKS